MLICDEAQELTDEQMAALMPVISAGRNQNSQTILIGTPPSPTCTADVFKSARDRAMSDNPGKTCWHEWSVEEVGDTTDWGRVEATNPALDVRLMRASVDAEMSAMAPDYFARERLGWWSKQASGAVIKPSAWDKCRTDAPPSDGIKTFAVKFSPDGSIGTVAVCLRPRDGVPYVEVIDNRSMASGLVWFEDFLAARWKDSAQIVIDGMANAQPLIDRLRAAHVPERVIVKPTSSEMSAACSTMLNAVSAREVAHMGQPALDKSATMSTKRPIGSNGGWGFKSNADADSTLIEACSLALWSALNTKRDPSRKGRIS